MSNFTYSKEGLGVTEREEGLRLTSYQDQVGVWTIGYGHTGKILQNGQMVLVGPDQTITLEYAGDLLASDISWASNVVNKLVTYPINQGEFDALVDFVFNVGATKFAGSTLLKVLNAGDIADAAGQFDLWDHAGGKVVAGLLRRRQDETQEFTQST